MHYERCKNADNDPHASLGDSFKNALPGWCETKKAGAIFFWLAFGFRPASLILDWRVGNLGTLPRDQPFTRPDADVEEGEEEEEGEEGEHSYQPVANTIPTYPRQSTYDNSNATASPFADTNRLSTPPTNTSTIRLSTAQPTTNHLSVADSSINRTSAYPTAPTTTTASTTSKNYPASRPSMDAYGAFSDPAPSGFGGVSTTYAPPPSDPVTPRVSRMMQYADPYAAVRASLATNTTSPPSYEPYTGHR
ncbi:hypothetical protein M405DRAFT_881509 [Rhizopogon salebrosus TDB-379]|nr:hypothetical protein M405DRAFT_881509 [Rhizopogon salebrosus TDB-379]